MLFSIGVSNEQLVQNMAERLRKDIDSIRVALWLPKVEELKQEEELLPLVLKLLSAFIKRKERARFIPKHTCSYLP